MAVLIKANGEVSNVSPQNGTFTLDELYALVCPGDDNPIVQAVPAPGDLTVWCHEEGKLRGLPPNHLATARHGAWLDPSDWFCGDVLVTEAETEGGE